ncbi:hypothetical protein ES703_31235 [subsurface metagenome]
MKLKLKKKQIRLIEELHQEYHKAEKKVCKKFGIKRLSLGVRGVGVIAYLSCVAIQEDHQIDKKEKKS